MGNKNGQTWQVGQHSKGSEMVNLEMFLTIWDPFGPIWTLGPFQTKLNLLPHKDKRFRASAFEQKIIFARQGEVDAMECKKQQRQIFSEGFFDKI